MRVHVRALAIAALGFAVPATASAGAEGRIAYLALAEGFWQVWTISPTGGEAPHQVTRSPHDKASVSWYPDGRSLLVNALDGKLTKVDWETGLETPIALPVEGVTDAVVSPDGETIAFSFSAGGSVDANEIWTVHIDGTELRRRTDLPKFQHQPRWSPDGRWLYFLSASVAQDHDVWRMSVARGTLEKVTAGGLYHFEIAVAPDGRLAYSSNRSGDYEIYAEQSGGEIARLTDDPGLDGHPTWSRDGRRVVFHSARTGNLGLWEIAASGGEAVALVQPPGGARNPEWWQPGEAMP